MGTASVMVGVIPLESLLAAGRGRRTPAPRLAGESGGAADFAATLPFGTVGTLAVLAVLLVILGVTLWSMGRSRSGMAPKAQVKRQLGRPALQRAAHELRPALVPVRKGRA